MADEQNFTNTHSQARSKAIKVAAEVVGIPEDYKQEYITKGSPKTAPGIRGAFGATDSNGSTTSTMNTYTDALIHVANYIVTGRTETDQ